MAEREADIERVRIEIARCESDGREKREAAHAHEVEIGRLDQRIQGDEAQQAALTRRAADIGGEIEALAARRGPAAEDLAAKQREAGLAAQERDGAATALAAANDAQAALQTTLDGFEADVEAVRAEQYAAASAATAIQHAIENAVSARDRVSRDLARWSAEAADLQVEATRAQDERQAASAALDHARGQLGAVMRERTAREAEVTSLRGERDRLALTLREHEQDLADAAARLNSLEEFETARTAYGDAARLVLSESAGAVQQAGSVADYLEVAPGYERAVEACLGDALQYVVVSSHDEAARGLAFVRDRNAGRCGFVVAGGQGAGADSGAQAPVPGLTPLASVVSVIGPYADAIRPLVARAWLAPSYAEAVSAAAVTSAPIATPDGDVCHGPRVVLGGSSREESRGILRTKRDLKDLRERLAAERSRVSRLVETAADIEHRLAVGVSAIESLTAEIHRQEMAAVGFELRTAQADDDIARIGQKQDLVALDARRAEEEIAGLDVRQTDARRRCSAWPRTSARSTDARLDVPRDEISIPTIAAAVMIDDTTAYIRLQDFAEQTGNDLLAALKSLSAKGMRRLLLDLRGNPGGPLDQAIRVSNEFLQKGQMIVYTRGRIPNSDQDYRATERGNFTDLPLVVLVNRSSASASEIVSGALQDHDRAVIVGETTFGKALVQSVYRISDNAALALTTARYHTPSGRMIQRPWDGTFDEYLMYTARTQNAPREHAAADLKYTDAGRKVYGGGGVEPDHRLEGPVEGFNPNRFSRLLLGRQVFASFAQKFSAVGDTRIAVEGRDRKFVAKDFTVDAAMLQAFREHATAEGVKIDEEAFAQDLPFITAMIRYEIDLNLWTVEHARRRLIMADPQAQLALTYFGEAEGLVQAARGRASRGNH